MPARAKSNDGAFVALNKPYGVLSQFVGERGQRTLAAFGLPKDLRVAGRLDADSEGLLLLSRDGAAAKRLLSPGGHGRVYWALTARRPDAAALAALTSGVTLKDGPARALWARRIAAPGLPEREPPPRGQGGAAPVWIEIALDEGRNRQARRMLAAVDAPVLRLWRAGIGGFILHLNDLKNGRWRALSAAEGRALTQPARPIGIEDTLDADG